MPPIINMHRDPELFEALKTLICQGAGGQDIIGNQTQPCKITHESDSFRYEIDVERKHAGSLLPFIQKISDLNDLKILDYGCGTAGLTVALAAMGALVTGVEPVQDNLKAAKIRVKMYDLEKSVGLHFVEDTTRLPFEDCSFDACICNSVLEYIYVDRPLHIKEMWRLIRPGGLLFITDTPNALYPLELHTCKWFINYQAKRAARERMVRGASYWEIKKALYTPGYKPEFLDAKRAFDSRSISRKLLETLPLLLYMAFGKLLHVPMGGLSYWLNLVFRKQPV